MDPITLMSVTSVGATAAGGIMSGISGASQARYLQGVAQANARINAANAQYERQVGEIRAQRVGMEGQQREGAIVAAQGASGLDVTRGSAVDVQRSQREAVQLDEATERANAIRRAYGYQVREAQDVAQAGMYAATARNIIPSSIIGTASSVADKWLMASRMGVGTGVGTGAGGWAGGMGLDLYGTGGLS